MKYETVIGLEVHVELATKSKIFCSCGTEFGAGQNNNVCPACRGMPGMLPIMNKNVGELGIRAGLLTNCRINRYTTFDKKSYYYPDLPSSYQTTQWFAPICVDGGVEIETSEGKKVIGIKQIHMEEDAGKLVHDDWTDTSLVDYNRTSVPLIEIVSRPDLSSVEEVVAYLDKLKTLLRFAKVSDCKMEEGSMRADANVSIRKNESDPYGTKAEIKNIGSISNVGISIEKEIERQSKLYDAGEIFQAQTRRYDDKIGDTVLMRVKETGNDYRYFPEPDIPFLYVTDEMIEEVRKTIPMLPDERKEAYISNGVSEINATKLIQNRSLSDYFNELLNENTNLKIASNLLLGDISAYLNKEEKTIEVMNIDDLPTKVRANIGGTEVEIIPAFTDWS